jgi:hypothetical protein
MATLLSGTAEPLTSADATQAAAGDAHSGRNEYVDASVPLERPLSGLGFAHRADVAVLRPIFRDRVDTRRERVAVE